MAFIESMIAEFMLLCFTYLVPFVAQGAIVTLVLRINTKMSASTIALFSCYLVVA